jgi:hypothetical protein
MTITINTVHIIGKVIGTTVHNPYPGLYNVIFNFGKSEAISTFMTPDKILNLVKAMNNEKKVFFLTNAPRPEDEKLFSNPSNWTEFKKLVTIEPIR